MKRWSKLQRELYKLIDPELDFQLHCSIYRMQSSYGGTDLPRYWITLGDEIIFDYPKQFVGQPGKVNRYYPYITNISQISDLIREYIDTPKYEVFDKQFENDRWGLISILKAADRRNGTRRLQKIKMETPDTAAMQVIAARLNKGVSIV